VILRSGAAVAQALEHGTTIVTRDVAFDAYGVPVLRA
jgi:PIN domain nuclease of toxin-antitoxin system